MALTYNGTEPTAITYNGTSLNVLQYGSTTVWGKPFSLTTSAGANTTIGVNRISSPNQHASTGGLESGAKVYYGDVLQIDASADYGYTLSTFTVNGTTWTSGNTITVDSAITVVTSATQAHSWHEVWTGSVYYTVKSKISLASFTVSGLKTILSEENTQIKGRYGTATGGTAFNYGDTEVSFSTSTLGIGLIRVQSSTELSVNLSQNNTTQRRLTITGIQQYY